MRALRLSILVMAAILAAGLINGAALSHLCGGWTTELESAALCAQRGQWDDAQQTLSTLGEGWQRQQGYLCATLEHDAITQADGLLRQCKLAAQEQDADALFEYAVQLRLQLSRLAESEQLSLKNIL